MRVLIIGGDGMLGHQLLRRLRERHEVRVTLRRPLPDYAAARLFDEGNARGGIDVRDAAALQAAIDRFAPEAVFNAAGVVKQRGDAADAVQAIEVNALFPHRLAAMCAARGAWLVHYSTDCVFSGRRGGYSEDDVPDPVDLYGRSKLLGEVDAPGCLVLRTSMIGPELSRKTGLLEWFLSRDAGVSGYRRAIFSGLTTLEHARIAERLLARKTGLSGLFHLSADAISKFDLLHMIRAHFGLRIDIAPDDAVAIDRSLDSTRFRAALDYRPPDWERMVAELAGARRAATS